jgi:hypothetical protein
MAEQVAELACDLTGPVPPFVRGWTEILTEALDKLGEMLSAQFRAGLRAAEAGSRVVTAPEPEEVRAGMLACCRHGVEALLQAADLLGQGTRFATAWGLHLLDGMRTVGEDKYRRRLAECAACEFYWDNHCLSCGCRLGGDVAAKARWADGQCPLGKWGR